MHDHSHSHGSNNRIGWAFFLNVTFTIIEFIGGILTNSTAIMADAVHDLGDSLSIGFAWFLSKVSEKGSNSEFTYGYRRLSLFGALINGLVLIIGSVWVLTEAIPKLLQPEMPIVEGMIALAVFGVLVNGFAAYKLSKGKTLNERVLNWHLLEDVLGWVAVLIVSIVLLFVDWPILDPALSILFTLYILINVAKNLWHTIRLFLQAIPDKELSKSVYKTLIELKEVDSIHHLHLWSLDGEHHVLTAHLALQEALSTQQQLELKKSIAERLSKFNLEHTTIELEMTNEQCRDDSQAL
ncbi:cation diffusion facilitator family transporter [Alteromonas macleodii]|jgi:cobalt-zinc-cadmium efflux system protein|uniref:Cobalt transporter n=3 Tax=Alteromonadales TaxID=135622 RepID=A0A0F4PY97_9GAMM|nr:MULTISPECIES: cation diffusion facilitator family transporter [Alteromonadales]MEC8905115.1 cation diffusion facilitator family transporter [Pseudomonadota bacterium]AXR06653.1 cation transporter [Salinimonas sediminis]KJY95681.1 cobalt transporter [Pseudoalteromonas ruthenica]KJZ00431.1 cobalt transporter [Pseudoalteromonas ruthenica]MCG7650017.1 cation diffusion facilitator family transporter [Alteromonas sp. MmMcT2-5]|tara:strand:+ start:241 stop:1128 length:888 start_codon:yes stop_codon:yes gene_type:complete